MKNTIVKKLLCLTGSLLLVLSLPVVNLAAQQNSDSCECAEYYLNYGSETPGAVGVIPAEAKGFRVLRIYGPQKYRRESKSAVETILFEYTFDQNGRVASSTSFFRRKAQYLAKYERHADGKISRVIRSIAKGEDSGPGFRVAPTIERYTYDASGRLIRTKTSTGNPPEFAPDSVSEYQTFEYDELGRLQRNFTHHAPTYSGAKMRMTSTYEYEDNQRRSYGHYQQIDGQDTSEYSSQGWVVGFDSSGLAISEGTTDGKEHIFYNYDDKERLTSIRSIPVEGYGTECPDGSDYLCEYFYGPHGLLSRMRHTYADVVCELRLEYE